MAHLMLDISSVPLHEWHPPWRTQQALHACLPPPPCTEPDCCCADFVAHPVVVSGGILILLALSLSPYILALGGVALVLTGGSLIPGPIRGILPAPLQQVSSM